MSAFSGNDPGVSLREMLISSGSALLSLLITVALARLFLAPSAQPFLVASMGATAVLLYAASASPMAQPWPVFGGHLVSALVGVTCARYIHDPAWAAALAGGGAILAMYLLRCMHPPGGATALMPVASASVGELGYHYLFAPVGVDLVLMLALALLINHYLLRRPYPANRHPKDPHAEIASLGIPSGGQTIVPPFDAQDLQQAMQAMDTYIDVTDQDLLRIYGLARRSAYVRKAGDLRCATAMQTTTDTLSYGTALSEAVQLLRDSGLPALPVLGRGGQLIGVFGAAQLMAHAADLPGPTQAARLQALIIPSDTVTADKPETVGQVMQSTPRSVTPEMRVSELLASLDDNGPAIVPVVDADNRLLGVIDPGALMGRLHRLAVAERVELPSARPASG